MDKIYDITIDVSKWDNKNELLLLQKELAPHLNVKIDETDVQHFDISPETAQLVISLYFKAVLIFDAWAFGKIGDRVYNYFQKNKGTGVLDITTKKEDENLDIKLHIRKPSKEELMLQIKQFSHIIANNLDDYRKFTIENRQERKITFVYDEKSKLIVPIDYYQDNQNKSEIDRITLERLMREAGKFEC